MEFEGMHLQVISPPTSYFTDNATIFANSLFSYFICYSFFHLHICLVCILFGSFGFHVQVQIRTKINLWDWKVSNIQLPIGNGHQPFQWLGYVACNYIAFENSTSLLKSKIISIFFKVYCFKTQIQYYLNIVLT